MYIQNNLKLKFSFILVVKFKSSFNDIYFPAYIRLAYLIITICDVTKIVFYFDIQDKINSAMNLHQHVYVRRDVIHFYF